MMMMMMMFKPVDKNQRLYLVFYHTFIAMIIFQIHSFIHCVEMNNNNTNISPLPYCKGNEYVNGKWVNIPPDPNIIPPCCSWDEEYEQNSERCEKGKGIPFAKMSGFSGVSDPQNPHYRQSGGHGCRRGVREGWKDMYTWIPSNCKLLPFSSSTFCDQVLKNRSLALIGDSIMFELGSTFINHLVLHNASASCLSRVSYGHSNTLIGKHQGNYGSGEKWTRWAEIFNADIVLISVSAHLHTNETFFDEIRILLNQFQGINLNRKENPMKLIWRTQPNAGCKDHILDKYPSQIPNYWDDYHESKIYNYNDFEYRDKEVSKILLNIPNTYFFDISPLLYRADAHVTKGDCLHINMPGPLDIVPQLLMNYMLTMGI